MDSNTVIGNICADPTLRMTRKNGRAMARFKVAVNQRRRFGEETVDRPPVFHRVTCFGPLAENVSNSLRKGMEVLAVGEWVDDSYEDENGQKHTHVALEAKAIGAGLRWATAAVTKVERPARVIPLPDPPTPEPDSPIDRNDDHESDEFSANEKPPEPVSQLTHAMRKGERQAVRAS
jgi:single-strand DNA-binding protein